jgi:hypothetical protein
MCAAIEQGSSGNLTPILNGVIILPYTVIGNGRTVVPSAGTAVPLSTSTAVKTITIRALNSNTGKVYVGSSSVNSSNGFQCMPDETISIDFNNLGNVYIDVDNSGEGVSYIWLS